MNTSGAASVAAASSLLFSSLLALSSRSTAQAPKYYGKWVLGFDHEHGYVNGQFQPGSNATDFMAPFPNGEWITAPDPSNPGHTLGEIGGPFGWGDPAGFTNGLSGKFNALHMALIPKGPHRGKVIVWNTYPVIIQPGLPWSATDWWFCQAWSIVDPTGNPPGPRFHNYLLPIDVWKGTNASGSSLAPPLVADPNVMFAAPRWYFEHAGLFCSGHAWSQHGDLVIAGGDRFRVGSDIGVIKDNGTNFLYMLDLGRPSTLDVAPVSNAALYSGDVGRWQKPPLHQLGMDRWYPTVTLTHRLGRTTFEHTVIVSGGTNRDQSYPAVPNPAALTDPRQTFESFVVRPSILAGFLQRDFFQGQNMFFGAAAPALIPLSQSWLHEYPRLHLLSDGKIFFSGYAAMSARLDPEVPPIVTTAPPRWDFAIGNTGAQWSLRHDGNAVHFARVGGFQNLVLRLNGSDGVGGLCTDTAEFCPAASTATPPAGWTPIDPTPRRQVYTNAVILPDASVLVVGGTNQTGQFHLTWQLFTLQNGWIEADTLPTFRGYHSTAVLLPDGRVLAAGGEGRHDPGTAAAGRTDYDIYEPPYLHNGRVRPTGVELPNDVQQPDGYHLTVNTTDRELRCDPLPGMDTLEKVVLIAPGSITHHSDMSARYIELPTRGASNSGILFDVPGPTIALPGYYMLWAVTAGGTPSVAVWVKVEE